MIEKNRTGGTGKTQLWFKYLEMDSTTDNVLKYKTKNHVQLIGIQQKISTKTKKIVLQWQIVYYNKKKKCTGWSYNRVSIAGK